MALTYELTASPNGMQLKIDTDNYVNIPCGSCSVSKYKNNLIIAYINGSGKWTIPYSQVTVPLTASLDDLVTTVTTLLTCAGGGGGGGGDATAANQLAILQELQNNTAKDTSLTDILNELGNNTAKDSTLTDILNELGQKTEPGQTQLVSIIPQIGEKDTFNRSKVSLPYSMFSSAFNHDSNPFLWERLTFTGGTAVFDSNKNQIDLNVTTTAGSRVISEQHGYNFYQPGRGHSVKMTGVLGSAVLGVSKKLGYFNDRDGLFFERYIDGIVNVALRTSTSGAPVTTRIQQVNWNIDSLDGNGPSTVIVDFTKDQIYFIEFQFLGAGVIYFGIVIDGTFLYAHKISNANILLSSYMRVALLPARYEIHNEIGSAATDKLIQICTDITSDGGELEKGYKRACFNTTPRVISTRQSLLSLRLALLANATTNRGFLIPESIEIMTTSNQNLQYEIIYQQSSNSETNLGGVPTWNTINNSYAEFSEDGTTVTGGAVIESGFINSITTRQINIDLSRVKSKIALNILGTQSDYIHIVVKNLGGGSSNCYSKINYIEFR